MEKCIFRCCYYVAFLVSGSLSSSVPEELRDSGNELKLRFIAHIKIYNKEIVSVSFRDFVLVMDSDLIPSFILINNWWILCRPLWWIS